MVRIQQRWQTSLAQKPDEVGLHFTTSVARIAVWPAPQGREHSMMKRPAVSAVYLTTVSPRRRLGISDVDLGADDAKAVIGVVAGEVELDHRAFFDGDFRRRVGEALGGDANHLRGLGISRS